MRCPKHPNNWIGLNDPGFCPVCASERTAKGPSDATACSRPSDAEKYAEALNDIADMLQLPTGVTCAEIVEACLRTRNIVIEECAVAIQMQERGTRYQWMSDSHFGTMTQEMAGRLRRIKSSENT
jgi:hypothetical protein